VPDEVSAAARRALDDVPINVGFARAVVDARVPGELWCDRPEAPRAFHAVHPSGMSLVWGTDVAAAADDVAAHIHERAALGRVGEWLQVEPRWDDTHGGGAGWREALGAVLHERVNFRFDRAAFTPPAPLGGARARRATQSDYTWEGSTVPDRYWPDAASFAEHGCGWVVEQDGTPAALAFRAFPGDDDVEVGIETLPAFRRRGLARMAAGAMIADVVATGRTPVWSCRAENVGSVRLAESLGFTPSLRLPYYEVPARAV